MLSNKDMTIKELINKEKSVDTFFKHVFVDVDDLEDYCCEACYELHLDSICHIWTGPIAHGYGYWATYSKELGKQVTIKAHRFAYAYANGFDELPRGVFAGDGKQLVINHMCHNRACVNPMHLEVITHRENTSVEKRKPRNV
jgi:hypothetical protein